MANYYQDPFGAPDYSAEDVPSLLSLSNLESLGRGSLAGLLGGYGDIQSLFPDTKYRVKAPSSEELLQRTPRMTEPTPQAGLLETAGGFMSPAPAAVVKPLAKTIGKTGKAVARMAGEEINAAMMGERGGLLGALTPQPMRIIDLKKGIYKPELTMEEMLKVKDIPTVDRVRQSIDLVGEKEFQKMVDAQFKKYKPTNPETEAMLVESVTLDILGRAQRKSPYPQQAALDLAQQRAALPVEQGGLGLPANNTPEMRAQAMGFETPVYHATDIDFTAIRPSVKGKYGAGVYTATSPKYAEIYAQGENARTLPLMARGKIASDDERIAIADQILEQYRNNQSMSAPLWKEKTKEELANRGYTGVGIGKERLMFNPEDLRSRFAAFDPFRKDVATATAMGVALPDLLAAEPTPQDQSSGLLYPYP